MTERFKRRTHEVLTGARRGDRLSQAVQWFIIALIVLIDSLQAVLATNI